MQAQTERDNLIDSMILPQISANSFFSSQKKDFTKRFLEQSKGTALGGAVILNHTLLGLSLMGQKPNHKLLEMVLLSYWALRGGAAVGLELSGLKNKAPDALAFYTLTEKNVIKMLAITSFLRKMPIPFAMNSALQIACSIMVVLDHSLSTKAIIDGKPDPSGGSIPTIKAYYEGYDKLAIAAISKEMAFKSIQMGATTYTAGYALADVFVDAVSPIDPVNQELILKVLALTMALLGAASVAHPITNEMTNQVRAAQINTGLIFLPLVSLMYDLLPAWFSDHSLGTGLIAMCLVVVIPMILELMVSLWDNQENIKHSEIVSEPSNFPNVLEDSTVEEVDSDEENAVEGSYTIQM